MQNVKADYDSEHDSLFIYTEGHCAKGSVELADFILDYDEKGKLCSIEILNATKFFGATRSELSRTRKCMMDVRYRSGWIAIAIALYYAKEPNRQTIQVPQVEEVSPALVYA